jgi:hypothetical protein
MAQTPLECGGDALHAKRGAWWGWCPDWQRGNAGDAA